MSNYQADEKVLLELKAGDQTVVNDLYGKWEKAFVFFIMRRFQCSQVDAEEIFPETFAKFYFNIKDGKLQAPLKSTLKTYCFGIGKNLFFKRHLDKYKEVTDLEAEFPDAGQLAEPLELYEYEAQKKLVSSLLQRIDTGCQELLKLIFIDGYAHESVAAEMNIPSEGAVRKRKFDCLKKMRKMLQGQNIAGFGDL